MAERVGESRVSEITQAGATSTGMPLTAALPEATSTKAPGARMSETLVVRCQRRRIVFCDER
jgi:hypothetical protein